MMMIMIHITYTCAYMSTHMHAYIHTMNTYNVLYKCMYVHLHTYIYIHTFTYIERPMALRTNDTSDQWHFGLMALRTNGTLDYWEDP